MRCETARKRMPEDRASAHVASCEACSAWAARVRRGAGIAESMLGRAPAGLAVQVLSRTAAPAPPLRAPAPRRIRRMPVRALAAAASFLVAAGAAAIWFVGARPTPAEAVAAAAVATKRADSARFTFQGDFAVELQLSEGLVGSIERAASDGVRGLERALTPPWLEGDLRKGIAEHADLAREWLGRGIRAGAGLVTELRPRVALRLTGEGAFAPQDRVRMAADLRLVEPVEAGGGFEFVRLGDEAFTRPDGAPWVELPGGLPAELIRPVGSGLTDLADWIHREAARAAPLGREELDGVETERYRLPLPTRRQGTADTVEVWVGVDDGYLHRILLSHRLGGDLGNASARIDVRLLDHGSAQEIARPEGAMSTREAPLLPGLRGELAILDDWVGSELPGPGQPAA